MHVNDAISMGVTVTGKATKARSPQEEEEDGGDIFMSYLVLISRTVDTHR